MQHPEKKPVFLLTGFLGTGKTTFLNRLLKQSEFANSLVIINEFGEVSVDHLLVEESAETIFELSNGCLCCSVRGELVETLSRLNLETFDRIFIETTGIADPLPVFQAMAFHPTLSKTLLPAPILCVYDTSRGKKLLEQHEEARKQIALADSIIFSKCSSEEERQRATKLVSAANPNAQLLSSDEAITQTQLMTLAGEKPTGIATGHSAEFRSTVLETDGALPASDLFGLLQLIINHYGQKLLRIKGHAILQEFEQPVIVQVSGQIVHEPEPARSDIEKTRLVVIVKDAEVTVAKDFFNAITGHSAIDTADREALMNNPLNVPGASF